MCDFQGSMAEPLAEKRWLLLFLSCWLMFGNFYAFDNPSALNRQLKIFLSSADDVHQYQLNMLYSVYSLPNIVLPFIAGLMLDKWGHGKMLPILSALVAAGQFIFVMGVTWKSFGIMVVGRVIFGLGGESLSVAQARLMTEWFRGKELALALGLNLSVARIGTVVNNMLSPTIAASYSVPFALWVGFISCIISYGCAIVTVRMDKKYGKDRDIERIENGSDGRNTFVLSMELDTFYKDETSSTYEPNHGISPSIDAINSSIPRPIGYHPLFWVLVVIIFTYYGSQVPFNNIISDFLQTKYGYDAITTGRIMSIPDSLAIFLVPPVGMFVDRVGYRAALIILCGISMMTAHLIMGLSDMAPFFPLVLLGCSYSFILAFWPCVPLLVDELSISTAYGILTSSSNFAFFIVPILVAAQIIADPTYTQAEVFFAMLTTIGWILAVLFNVGAYWQNLKMNNSEYMNRHTRLAQTGSVLMRSGTGRNERTSPSPTREDKDKEEPIMVSSLKSVFKRSRNIQPGEFMVIDDDASTINGDIEDSQDSRKLLSENLASPYQKGVFITRD